jgi:hypothetical protein
VLAPSSGKLNYRKKQASRPLYRTLHPVHLKNEKTAKRKKRGKSVSRKCRRSISCPNCGNARHVPHCHPRELRVTGFHPERRLESSAAKCHSMRRHQFVERNSLFKMLYKVKKYNCVEGAKNSDASFRFGYRTR